ncbi:MAG: S41 family peptidase [Bacilli bacterium]|nr:S41 family peptidase [Bacilli bacterium]
MANKSKKDTTKKNNKIKKEVKEKDTNKEKITKKEIYEKNKKEKQKNKEKDFFSTTEVVIITLIALIVGIFSGTFITTKSNNKTNSKEIREFITTYTTVTNNYYKKVNKKKLVEAAINGMFDYLGDPHSIYMDEKETESFNQTMEGTYKGIGATIQQTDDGIKIVGIFKKSPAEKAGLKENDYIIKVNGKKTEGKTADETVRMIKKKDKAVIVVKRGDEEKSFDITLEVIDIPSVEGKIIEKDGKKVGIITLSIFAKNTGTQFKNELDKLEKDGMEQLIIDVRGNTGGYLDQASDIISNFMDKSHVIYQVERKGKKTKYYSTGTTTKQYKIAVLVNGGSASASEILAAALKESYGAEVIGTTTYGKGTVQTTTKLEGGASIKYTIERWLTPKGNSINETGIAPTIEVELSDDYYENPKEENDNQLQRALEEITKSN